MEIAGRTKPALRATAFVPPAHPARSSYPKGRPAVYVGSKFFYRPARTTAPGVPGAWTNAETKARAIQEPWNLAPGSPAASAVSKKPSEYATRNACGGIGRSSNAPPVGNVRREKRKLERPSSAVYVASLSKVEPAWRPAHGAHGIPKNARVREFVLREQSRAPSPKPAAAVEAEPKPKHVQTNVSGDLGPT